MMARRIVLAGMALAGAALLSSCGKPDNVLRYKMTVEVETPEGVKTGFAVREVRFHDRGGFPFGESRPQVKLHGEAVAVDLPGSKTLFALLTSGSGEVDYGARVADRVGLWGKVPAQPLITPVELYPTVPDTTRLKNTNPLPMLVRFRDMADPKSVERVEPDALDKVFGAGVNLKRITIAKTNEVVTVGIGKRLPSYGPETGFDGWFKTLKYGDPRAVSKYDFQRGTNQ